jgi:hypothetical protein
MRGYDPKCQSRATLRKKKEKKEIKDSLWGRRRVGLKLFPPCLKKVCGAPTNRETAAREWGCAGWRRDSSEPAPTGKAAAMARAGGGAWPDGAKDSTPGGRSGEAQALSGGDWAAAGVDPGEAEPDGGSRDAQAASAPWETRAGEIVVLPGIPG